ncbi:MAG: VWA domain-containing protein [Bacteroidales bacterium]|jgi:hypothetical protein|nr:VWA domain-containing protein [Bacteroidales bacterium]
MSILTEYSLWLVLPCLALGAGYAWLLYYRNRNIVYTVRTAWLLAICRTISVALIAFLFLLPMIKMSVKKVEKPLIICAIDCSESIVLNKDSAFYRYDYPSRLSRMLTSLDDKYEVIPYLVGEKSRQVALADVQNLKFTDRETDLSSFFDKVSSLYAHRNVGAVLLFSDGLYNSGSNPYYKIETARFPVYTLGMGDPNLQPNLFVSGIAHNKQTFKGNYFPVEIKIGANKLSGKKTTLTVTEKGKELFSKQISFSSARAIETINLTLEAGEKGMHHYEVVLSGIEGENNNADNRSSFFIEVIDVREKIAIIYGSPHPDIAALQQALTHVEKYQVEVFQANEFQAKPEDYSLVILHRLPSQTCPVSSLLLKINKENIPVLYIIGSQTHLPAFNALNTGLQITRDKNLFNESMASLNENFTSFTFSENAREALPLLPPLQTFFGDYKTSPSSKIFLYQNINHITTPYPLMVFNENNGTRTGILAGEGLWQWRMYNYLQNKNTDAFDELISKTVQLLSVKNDRSFFKIYAEQVYNENSEIEMSAELYNESYELINTPDVSLKLTGQDGKTYEALFSKEQNAYSLNLGELPVGDYAWEAYTRIGDQNYSRNGCFIVKEIMVEAANPVADHVLLQNIAVATRGKFYTTDQWAALPHDIETNEQIKSIASYKKTYTLLIDSWLLLALILGLLATEWFARKWGGGY